MNPKYYINCTIEEFIKQLKGIGQPSRKIMSRIALTDGSGRWFSEETAEKFKEETFHDGRNWISQATGSQWEHEALYRTKGGRFILNHWSNWQGSRESYVEIDNEAAAVWFSKNDYDPHPACEKEFSELEIK